MQYRNILPDPISGIIIKESKTLEVTMTEQEMWQAYQNINPDATEYIAWTFGGTTPEMPDILADLVLKGIKVATASAYPFYVAENEPLPEVGTLNLILNTKQEAVCIIRTTKVYTTPFKDVTAEHAYKEGEDDRSLDYWRRCHKEVYIRDLKEINQEFSEDMIIVCEEFEVVYPITESK